MTTEIRTWEMYTRAGDRMVDEAFNKWAEKVRAFAFTPKTAVEALDALFDRLSKTKTAAEVGDTEPRYHLRHRAKAVFTEVGFDDELIEDSRVGW